jgi:hypothetical protein
MKMELKTFVNEPELYYATSNMLDSYPRDIRVHMLQSNLQAKALQIVMDQNNKSGRGSTLPRGTTAVGAVGLGGICHENKFLQRT